MFLPLHVHGWLLFIISETITWLFVILLLIARYKWMAYRLSYLFMISAIICTLFQLFLVCVDYYFSGTVSFLQMVIILFIIYASTLGSNDMRRLDSYIQKKVNNSRIRLSSNVLSELKYRSKLFVIHTFSYFSFHVFWYFMDHGTIGFPTYKLFFFNEWINYPHQGYYTHSEFNIMSYLWKIFYAFDSLFFFIYISISVIFNRN